MVKEGANIFYGNEVWYLVSFNPLNMFKLSVNQLGPDRVEKCLRASLRELNPQQ